MTEYEVTFASRYIRLQFEKAVGSSVVKVLTEPITNSDDSYNDLMARNGPGAASAPGFGSIVIEMDRARRTFAIVDQAEGLDDRDMVERLTTYGDESAGRAGHKTRGLFGKGLRDVLFTQVNGQVRSIKDDSSYICKFRWRTKSGKDRFPFVEVQRGPRVSRELRESWGIVGNGTRVEFTLRKDLHMPQFDKLSERLENFYMLRLITANPDREVKLRLRRSGSVADERVIRHVPPAASSSATLSTKAWTLSFDGHDIRVSAELNVFGDDMVQAENGYEEREGGLLVFDENEAVLDLTLFGFDAEPAAARLFGTLRLEGVGALIRQKLNAAVPEEILTETRDGFDTKHQLYRQLRQQVDDWLKPFIEDERRRRAGSVENLSAATKKRHEEAFSRLNSLYRRLLGESTGGGIGPAARHISTNLPLEFRWKTLVLQIGAMLPAQLLVNTDLVRPGELVRIDVDDPNVMYPIENEIPVPEPPPDNRTVVIGVKLESIRAGETRVTARCSSAEAELACSVVDEEVPDLTSGLAFHPETLTLRDGERTRIKLFADLRLVRGAETVEITSGNPKIEITPSASWDAITSHVIRTAISVVGRGKGEDGVITAKSDTIEAIALVEVQSRRRKRREGGRFRGYKFQQRPDRKVQVMSDLEGYVIVNLADPTNRLYFGSDVVQATKRLEESPESRTLLADLILDECLQLAVSDAYNKGKLRQRLDTISDIRNYVAEQRFEIGAEIHRLITGKRLPAPVRR